MSSSKRSAVIMGASSGIGAATARALADADFDVHLMARRGAELDAIATATGGSSAVVDVTDAEALERATADLPPVAVAVYASGLLEVAAVEDHPIELWRRIIDVNLSGAFLFARALIPHLDRGGRMVFISSVSGSKGQPNLAAYAASKGGLNRLAESLAAELESRGIGVHVIAPGPVATPLLDRPGTSGFQLEAEQVAEIITWLVSLPDDVVLREVVVRAVMKGPFARDRHTEAVPGSKEEG